MTPLFIDTVRPGDWIVWPAGRSCITSGEAKIVHATHDGALFVACSCGQHMLEALADINGVIEGARRTELAPSEDESAAIARPEVLAMIHYAQKIREMADETLSDMAGRVADALGLPHDDDALIDVIWNDADALEFLAAALTRKDPAHAPH